ncbi:MAG: hypothetical protein PHI40_07725 [Caldisericia bacterium]|nr:hypothetical protein [Caldisericia bacterium]
MRISAIMDVPKHISRFNDEIADRLHLDLLVADMNDSIAFLSIFETEGTITRFSVLIYPISSSI